VRGTLQRIAPLWTRGEAGRPTPPAVAVALYTSWLVALALKTLGASWDVAWHFTWIRDTTAPPHLVDFLATAIAVALVLAHTYTGYRTLALGMIVGIGVDPHQTRADASRSANVTTDVHCPLLSPTSPTPYIQGVRFSSPGGNYLVWQGNGGVPAGHAGT
jgi:hypothetical protein